MKKILLKAPVAAEEILLTFPLLHALKEEYPEAEFSIVLAEGLFNYYQFLPFEIKTYYLPKDKDSMPGIHHFAYNLKDVFNIDLFLDLEGTVKSAFLGFNFKAHERIGYKSTLKKMFITHGIKEESQLRDEKYFLRPFESYLDRKIESLEIVGVDEESEEEPTPLQIAAEEDNPLKIEKQDYILVLIDKNKENLWRDFFDCFVGQRFVVLHNGMEELDKIIEEIGDKNEINATNSAEITGFFDIITGASAVVSDCFVWANIASYLAVKSFAFVDYKLNTPYLKCFKYVPDIVRTEADFPIKIISSEENKTIDGMNQFVDYLFKQIEEDEES